MENITTHREQLDKDLSRLRVNVGEEKNTLKHCSDSVKLFFLVRF